LWNRFTPCCFLQLFCTARFRRFIAASILSNCNETTWLQYASIREEYSIEAWRREMTEWGEWLIAWRLTTEDIEARCEAMKQQA
jgi:hypothetical protein